MLGRSPTVAHFRTADEAADGWGATLVTLVRPAGRASSAQGRPSLVLIDPARRSRALLISEKCRRADHWAACSMGTTSSSAFS